MAREVVLALVEEDEGSEMAREIARMLVVFLRRTGSQAQFSAQLSTQLAERHPIRELQQYAALAHFGIGVDAIGVRRELISDNAYDAVVAAFPRQNFKKTFHELVIEHVSRNPTAYLFTFLHESLRAHVCPVPTFDEAFFGSPFTE
jgi:hypothetical protein